MDNKQFAQPVPILVGLGYPHDIGSLWEAFKVLTEWPACGRGPAHVAALDACRDAMADECDAETARGKVEVFARSRGILAYDALAQTAQTAGVEGKIYLPNFQS
ncbi:DUF982 domain-containing protein [Mesorhizobium sp. WSM2239]|uniref:DUF982 domain-containing protein n=2 Tax=unclassified Mesorhizobium TaxID=325217 RepID=A0AAU8DC54_9HYPH